MRKLLYLFLLFCTNSLSAQSYNDSLAKAYNADEYGMKTYYFVFLERGDVSNKDTNLVNKIQRAHLDYITELAEKKILVVAGPFLDNTEMRGIFVLDCKNIEEAQQITSKDPAVQSGRLKMNVKPFYCSAALMAIPDLHKKVAKKEI